MGMPLPKCKVPKAKNNPDFAKGGTKNGSGWRCWIAQLQLLSEALLASLNQVNTCSMIRISPSFSAVLELRGGGSTKAWLFFSSELRTRAEMGAGVIPPARGYYWNLAKSTPAWCSKAWCFGNSQSEVTCSRWGIPWVYQIPHLALGR